MADALKVTPRVIDLSHYNIVNDLDGAVELGIWGIIHKATEGTQYQDARYDERRKMASDKGLLWGAYHFIRAQNVKAQVENFIKKAQIDDMTLLALDWETSSVQPLDIIGFLKRVEDTAQRKCVLYSGNTAKEQLGSVKNEYLSTIRLWHAQYAPKWVVHKTWEAPWLWQYSGDGLGLEPHGVKGIKIESKQICDMNHYGNSREQLESEWSGKTEHKITIPIGKATEEAPPKAPNGEILKMGSTGEVVKRLQKLLNVSQDGIYGLATMNAVKNFQYLNKIKADGIVGPSTYKVLESYIW